ncbi:PAS domain-containing protein [Inquilinus sp. CAU 1745]|uniref:PAS domain-containing protein n=1 Tax=Inquilinus sp. CAU 1745 TaxID=3140369 RepID=UPI00325A7DEB
MTEVSSQTGTVERLTVDEVASPRVKWLLAHWREKSLDRPYPDRRDLDPIEMKPVLPYLILSEIRQDPLDVRFRLVGTACVAGAGYDYTDLSIRETGFAAEADMWLDLYAEMIETAAPIFGADYVITARGKPARYEFAMFPLSAGGPDIAQCLSIEDFDSVGEDRFPEPRRNYAVERREIPSAGEPVL